MSSFCPLKVRKYWLRLVSGRTGTRKAGCPPIVKKHGFRILVDHLPGNRNVFSVKLVGNIEFKCERIKLSGSVRRSQAMGNRDVGFFCADEIHIPRETMLSAAVSFSVDLTAVFVIPSHIWKKNRRMAFPVSGISLPEYLAAVFLVINLTQLRAVILNLYASSSFSSVCVIKNPPNIKNFPLLFV